MTSTASRIRVAHLITNFAIGGAQDYMLMVLEHLDQSKFDVTVAGKMEGEWCEKVRSISGAHVVDIPALGREIVPCNDLRSVVQIRRFCRDHGIQILHTHSSKPGVVGRLAAALSPGVTTVHTVHGFSFHDFMPWWKRRSFILLERWMSRYTGMLLTVSEADKNTAGMLGIGAKKGVTNLYYGLEYEPYASQRDRIGTRKTLGLREDDFVVGFSGRFSEQKGLSILLRAFEIVHQKLPQSRLLLVGDGPLRSKLEHEARQMNIEEAVIITGYTNKVPDFLATMDVFVMTSFWEGLSRSLVEAMYSSLPVIATDVGGTSDAVRTGETGWLIPPNDAESAAAAILEVYRKPELAGKTARTGQDWAKRTFQVKKMIERLETIYGDLVDERVIADANNKDAES